MYCPFEELKSRTDILLFYSGLPDGVDAVLQARSCAYVIVLDDGLTLPERRFALTHELVHIERGGGCINGPEPYATYHLKEEERVNRVAFERLVPRQELTEFCLVVSAVEPVMPWHVADAFCVPVRVADFYFPEIVHI